MLFIALSVIVSVCNAILSINIERLFLRKSCFLKFLGIMNNFLSSGNITSNIIKFKSGDKQQCYDIVDKNVTIYGSVGNHDHGSSKVKSKNIVDYNWEIKDYPGHLIAVHLDGKYIAYVIKVSKVSGTEGMIRVTNAVSGKRALIKGMSDEVLDLQFAHLENDHVLAFIDQKTLQIHKIDMLSDNLICNLLLRIDDPLENYTPKYDKVSWCPYVHNATSDDSDDPIDSSQLIVWSRGGTFQCFNVNAIINADGIGKHDPENLSTGYIRWDDNSLNVTWVLLSPDGSTLGVGSDDGYIRFYQMYFHEKEPRCLHEWKPHYGKVISSFFFLDNLTRSQTDAYWKFALTGADGNTEFKIWDCGNWDCLQTISFASFNGKSTNFIAEIDRTSSYLVLTNRETRGLYVLQIAKYESNENNKTENDSQDKTEETAEEESSKKTNFTFIKSVSEFPLSSPILSFGIVDAAVRKYKCALNDNYLLDELDDYDEESNAIYCVVVRMFIVQPKSVQECHILYQPTVTDSCDVKSSISNESLEVFEDYLTDVSGSSGKTNISSQEKNSNDQNILLMEKKSPTSSPVNVSDMPLENDEKKNSSPAINNKHNKSSELNLMMPEAFNSTGKVTPERVNSEVLSTILMLAKVTGSNNATNKPENVNILNLVNNKVIEDEEKRKLKSVRGAQKRTYSTTEASSVQGNTDILASGGSSPSREVQEIMSQQNYSCKTYFNENEDNDKSLGDKIKSNTVNWPKVPDVRNVKHSAAVQNSSNIVSSTSLEINDLSLKMNQLIDLLHMQSSQINTLKNEIIKMKTDNRSAEITTTDLSEMGTKIEKQLSKLLEEYLKRYEREHKQKLEAFIAAKNSEIHEIRENTFRHFNQFIEKISNILAAEIQRHIVPILVDKLEHIKKQIQIEIAQKLTATDNILQENIAQNIIDAFGKSVLLGVQSGLQATYIESMSSTLIPAYEKSSQEMFKQLHDTFTRGIKDVMHQFDSYLSQLRPVEICSDEILLKLGNLQTQFEQQANKQQSSSDLLSDVKKEIKIIECNMTRNLTEIIHNEIKKSFETQAASLEDSVLSVVRSQAHTPAPMLYDVQDQIKHLLSQGQINKAFHQALIANDLSLVEYTLEKADLKSVFNPCALEQTVLLSLIQQISADMKNHNEIKHGYLSEAILNLNPADPITKEHAPIVVKELYKNCQTFLNNHPKSPLLSSVRVIMMAIQGLGFKTF